MKCLKILCSREKATYAQRQSVIKVKSRLDHLCCPGWSPSGTACNKGIFHILLSFNYPRNSIFTKQRNIWNSSIRMKIMHGMMMLFDSTNINWLLSISFCVAQRTNLFSNISLCDFFVSDALFCIIEIFSHVFEINECYYMM